ncbi:MAG TPA: GNAT family N-acetyltransferase [Caulifigura sp.]|nr:GNAT family N-acetyltransferase [Caulifigura sp.]
MPDVRLIESRSHILAVEGDRVTGTIGVIAQPGRVGLVFPLALDRPTSEVPGRLISAALDRLRRAGAAFAQLVAPLEQAEVAEPFIDSGFTVLTDALMLQLSLPPETSAANRDCLDAIACGPENDRTPLLELIRRVNVGSLDCPELDALRSCEDLLDAHAGHAQDGRARWWRFEHQGKDVGLLLACVAEDAAAWEILFFGVVPEQRGQGYGRKMLEQFQSIAAREITAIRAGLDSRNAFAARVYEDAGYAELGRLRVWIHPLRPSE